jgi:hypothetical protein
MCLGPCAGHYFFVPVSVPAGEGFRHADVVFIVKIVLQHETRVERGSCHTLMATTPSKGFLQWQSRDSTVHDKIASRALYNTVFIFLLYRFKITMLSAFILGPPCMAANN